MPFQGGLNIYFQLITTCNAKMNNFRFITIIYVDDILRAEYIDKNEIQYKRHFFPVSVGTLTLLLTFCICATASPSKTLTAPSSLISFFRRR
jgi:amino acid transporter